MDFFRAAGEKLGLINKPQNTNRLQEALEAVKPYGPDPSEMIDTGIMPKERALLDTISKAEGTYLDAEQKPDYTRRYGDDPNKPGTLDVTKPHPRDVRNSPWGSGYRSNASGAYQFLDHSWEDENNGKNVVMSPLNQDRSALSLATKKGFEIYGDFEDQAHKISGSWASIPNAQGVSAHGQPVKKLSELTEFYNNRLSAHEDTRRDEVYAMRGDAAGPGETFEKSNLTSTPADSQPSESKASNVSRKFGQEAVLNGKAVKWGGDNYGWQSEASFNKIRQDSPEIGPSTPAPAASSEPVIKAPEPGKPKYGDTNVITGKRYAGDRWGWQSEESFNKVSPVPGITAPAPGQPKFGDTNVVTGKIYAGPNYGWQSKESFNQVAPLFNLGK